MYGLKEAGVLAYDQLSKYLNKYGYTHVQGTVGLWTHNERRTAFCLCVDAIAIRYYNNDFLQHLLSSIGKHYSYHFDRFSRKYMGLAFDWNYKEGYVDISMPKYIDNLLHKFQHPLPTKPEYSPHIHYPFKHNKKTRVN